MTAATLPDVRDLAQMFAGEIQADMSASDLAAAVALNAAETDDLICHTHDFLDANMSMLNAMALMGVVFDPDDDAEAQLVNEAWSLAKAAGFAATEISPMPGGYLAKYSGICAECYSDTTGVAVLATGEMIADSGYTPTAGEPLKFRWQSCPTCGWDQVS